MNRSRGRLEFYSDLFKVIGDLQQKRPRDYKYDCFEKYLEKTALDTQAAEALQRSISHYAQALAHAPAGWTETIDVRHRRSVMQGRDPRSIDALGWHFCAD